MAVILVVGPFSVRPQPLNSERSRVPGCARGCTRTIPLSPHGRPWCRGRRHDSDEGTGAVAAGPQACGHREACSRQPACVDVAVPRGRALDLVVKYLLRDGMWTWGEAACAPPAPSPRAGAPLPERGPVFLVPPGLQRPSEVGDLSPRGDPSVFWGQGPRRWSPSLGNKCLLLLFLALNRIVPKRRRKLPSAEGTLPPVLVWTTKTCCQSPQSPSLWKG